jgi:hypothetical protein
MVSSSMGFGGSGTRHYFQLPMLPLGVAIAYDAASALGTSGNWRSFLISGACGQLLRHFHGDNLDLFHLAAA